jgi:sigma-B regulation protein RsbU (phosphoserine phosphatase)
VLRNGSAQQIDPTGLPLGLFCDGRYEVRQVELGAHDSLVAYSDGITEAQDANANEYGEERLIRSLHSHADQRPEVLAETVLADVARFRGGRPQTDDVTLMIVRRR